MPAPVSSAAHVTLGQDLQLLDTSSVTFAGRRWFVARWNLMRSLPPTYRTTYTYDITNMSGATDKANTEKKCVFSSIQAGDQLLVGFQPTVSNQSVIAVQVQSFTTTPYIISPRLLEAISLSFLTDDYQDSPHLTLKTADGNQIVMLSPSSQ
jgi:hypothetical protein